MNFYNIMQIDVEKLITIIIAITTIITCFLLRSVISYIIIKTFMIKEKDKKKIKNNAFYNPLKIFIGIFGIYIGTIIIGIPEKYFEIVRKIFKVIIIMLIANGISNLFSPESNSLKKLKKKLKIDISDNKINFLYKIGNGLIYTVAILISIMELDYDISGIIAGFGLGGVILTLAAQDTAKNLFGGIVLILDKSFIIGDWIETTNFEGIVEDITFRSTRLRTFDNSLVNIPNAILANESVINWSKMEKRKYKLDIKLSLDTSMDTVKKIINRIYFMLINHPSVINEEAYVKFDEIKEDGISIMISVFTNSIDYDSYLNAKEHINANILEILENENVRLAYPTQTIYVKK